MVNSIKHILLNIIQKIIMLSFLALTAKSEAMIHPTSIIENKVKL